MQSEDHKLSYAIRVDLDDLITNIFWADGRMKLDYEYFGDVVCFVKDHAPGPLFIGMLGQTHVNGWSRVIASQNGGSISYIFLFRLRVLQWSRHLFNYWKNKKTVIEKFLILLI